MDNRLKILCYRSSQERSGDTEGQVERLAGRGRPREIGNLEVKYAKRSEGLKGRENKYRRDVVRTGEKSHYREQRYPYRKPTQVGEERILRRAGEVLLRNSAKYPRKLARRGAWRQVAEKRPKQLFIKNTGLCKIER